jgi:hypothetical protein
VRNFGSELTGSTIQHRLTLPTDAYSICTSQSPQGLQSVINTTKICNVHILSPPTRRGLWRRRCTMHLRSNDCSFLGTPSLRRRSALPSQAPRCCGRFRRGRSHGERTMANMGTGMQQREAQRSGFAVVGCAPGVPLHCSPRRRALVCTAVAQYHSASPGNREQTQPRPSSRTAVAPGMSTRRCSLPLAPFTRIGVGAHLLMTPSQAHEPEQTREPEQTP